MNEPVKKSLRVECGVEHAFEVFTSRIDLWWPRSHRRFAGSVMLLEPAVGGRFTERTPAGEDVRLGEVIRYEPPHAISYTWYPGAIEEPTSHGGIPGDPMSMIGKQHYMGGGFSQ